MTTKTLTYTATDASSLPVNGVTLTLQCLGSTGQPSVFYGTAHLLAPFTGTTGSNGTASITSVPSNADTDDPWSYYLFTARGETAAGQGYLDQFFIVVPTGGGGTIDISTLNQDAPPVPGAAGPVTRPIWLPSTLGTTDSGTNTTIGAGADLLRTNSLADAATQGMFWAAQIPSDAVAAQALNMVTYWAPSASDATPHTVRWSVDAMSMVAGTDVTAAGTTTAFTGASAARTLNLMVVEPSTQVLATVNANDLIRINLRRIGADGADTYVGNVRLIGIRLDYLATE